MRENNSIWNNIPNGWSICDGMIVPPKKKSNMNYEKKYKEALANMQELYNSMKYMSSTDALHTTIALEKAFPELKESKDERIRKAIIKALSKKVARDVILLQNIEISEALAYLEKQGEQKPNPYSGISFEYNGHTWGMCARDGGVKILIDGELKTSVFAEQDKQNPAWSEEDEKAVNDIMWIIEAYRKNGFNETHIQIANDSENWLKLLKERYIWKPSDEQVEALYNLMKYAVNLSTWGELENKIESIYKDLKKLREE